MQGIIIARVLSQFDMGYFSQIKLIMSYLFFSNLGIMNGLLILIPGSDKNEIENIKATCFSTSLILFATAGTVSAVIGLLTGSSIPVIAGLVFTLYGMREIPVFAMRSQSSFTRLSIFHFISSFLSFAITVAGAAFFGLKGAVAGFTLYLLLSLVLGIFISKAGLKLAFNLKHFKALFTNGMQIYIAYLLSTLKDSSEKFIMIFFIDKSLYAVYSIGSVMSSFLDILPSAVFQYLLPDFIKDSAKWDQKRISESFTFMISIMTLFITAAIYSFTLLIPVILPKYTDSLGIFYILSFSSLTGIVNYLVYNKFVSEGKMGYMYAAQFSGALFLIITILAVLSGNFSLKAVALAVIVSRVFYAGVLIALMKTSLGIMILNKRSLLILFLSAAVIIMSINSAAYFVHSILLISAAYAGIMYRTFKWKR